MRFLQSISATIIAGAFLVSAQQSASAVAAALEQLAFQTYAIRPIVQGIAPSNVEQTLIGQGPVTVRNSRKTRQSISDIVHFTGECQFDESNGQHSPRKRCSSQWHNTFLGLDFRIRHCAKLFGCEIISSTNWQHDLDVL